MSHEMVGLIGFVILVVLILCGAHLAFTLIIAATIGFALIGGWTAALGNIAIIPFDRMSNYSFTVFPMFMLMGALVSQGGIGKEAYEMARTWVGQFKGGLAMATIVACGVFAAVNGTSLAGSIVMGKVAYPEMRRAGYKMSLAAGCVSVGGTLGILIPPSMGFILIGIMAELNIGQLFLAGILPGILVVIMYCLTIFIVCKRDPSLAPSLPKTSWTEKISSIKLTWPVIILFLLIMGGIYGGIFTATEAGAIGAFGALVIPLARRRMTFKSFWVSLKDTARMTGMVLALIGGVFLFNAFLAISGLPFFLSNWIVALPVGPWVIMVVIIIFYLILGMFFDVIAIVIITIPILFPAVEALGFDLIWYSVIMVRLIEIGEISPPFGINLFGLKGVIDAPLGQIYRGVIPYLMMDMFNLVVLCAFPVISTLLPYSMH